MKNPYKTSFFTLLTIFLLSTGFFVYQYIVHTETIVQLEENAANTENDLEQLSDALKGKLTRSDFKEIADRYPDPIDSTELGLNQIRIIFDEEMRFKGVTTQW